MLLQIKLFINEKFGELNVRAYNKIIFVKLIK